MKNDEFENLSQSTAEPPKKSSLHETARLFEKMTAEVRKQSEIEREDARRRSPLVKFLCVFALVSALSTAAIGAYGIYHFPDAPLRPKGEIFTGKHGQTRALKDYEKFLLWQKALFAGFGSTFFFSFAFAVLDAREKRRRRS